MKTLTTTDVYFIVNDVIKELYTPEGKVNRALIKKYKLENESINWGNLHCHDVDYLMYKQKYIVWIEEASPDAQSLQKYISSKFYEKTGEEIEVITTW